MGGQWRGRARPEPRQASGEISSGPRAVDPPEPWSGRDDMEARKGTPLAAWFGQGRAIENPANSTHRPGAHGEDTPYRWPETWVVFVPEDSCHPRGTPLWFHFAIGRRPASGKRLVEEHKQRSNSASGRIRRGLSRRAGRRVTLFILLPVVGGPCGVAGPGWKHGRSVRDGALALTRYSGRASLRPGLAVTSWTRAAVISEADHKCQSITTDLTMRFARRVQAELQCPGRAADQRRPGSTPRVPCADGLQRFGDDWPGLHQVFSRKAQGRFEETASMSSLTAGPSSDWPGRRPALLASLTRASRAKRRPEEEGNKMASTLTLPKSSKNAKATSASSRHGDTRSRSESAGV